MLGMIAIGDAVVAEDGGHNGAFGLRHMVIANLISRRNAVALRGLRVK